VEGEEGVIWMAMMPLRSGRRLARRAIRRFGYDIIPARGRWPSDFSADEIALCHQVAADTMISPEGVVTLAAAVRHIVSRGMTGAIVECGVWRGGSMCAVARTLLSLGRTDVDLYLFDTFEGMPPPTDRDVHRTGESAQSLLDQETDPNGSVLWARAGLDHVRAVLGSTGYPADRTHLIKGMVEDTIPGSAPAEIALLQLDTDWYESTKHELQHLYPRLAPGGILIIDDYWCWRGAGEATDEYFRENSPAPFLMRVDDSGRRMAVKDAGTIHPGGSGQSG
jgi:O-methyltransferase